MRTQYKRKKKKTNNQREDPFKKRSIIRRLKLLEQITRKERDGLFRAVKLGQQSMHGRSRRLPFIWFKRGPGSVSRKWKISTASKMRKMAELTRHQKKFGDVVRAGEACQGRNLNANCCAKKVGGSSLSGKLVRRNSKTGRLRGILTATKCPLVDTAKGGKPRGTFATLGQRAEEPAEHSKKHPQETFRGYTDAMICKRGRVDMEGFQVVVKSK